MKMTACAAVVSLGLIVTSPLRAEVAPVDPKLPIGFANAIPDICFQTARGRPLTRENAGALLLEAAEPPPIVKAHFAAVTSWFRSKAHPMNIFIGVGDRPNACHVILANTTQVTEVQTLTTGVLAAAGFKILQEDKPSPVVDLMFAKEAPDGYIVISLQGPRGDINGGEGDQGAAHVGLLPKALFESLVKTR